MSTLDKLLALGASAVGGDLIYKHKSLGQFRNGDFYPSAEGLALAEIDDVVIKSETPPAPTKAARKRADKDLADPAGDAQLSIEL
jgi:hypothetical protein